MFDISEYRRLERCVICGKRSFSKEEAMKAVIVSTGPTRFVHKECKEERDRRSKDMREQLAEAVKCYCGAELECEHSGEVECFACGRYTSLSGTIQTSGNHRKFYFEDGGWLLKADFNERISKQEKYWKESIKSVKRRS